MTKIKAAFAGSMAGLLILFGLSGPAGAVTSKSSASICETGGRGDAEYRKKCMRNGDIGDAAYMWYSTPVGKKGRENVNNFDRRSICKTAPKFGGITKVTREAYFDVAYDRFHNHTSVLRWIGIVAKTDCKFMGYKV